MRVINLGKYKKILKIGISIVLIFSIGILAVSKTFAMQHYYEVDFATGLVTADLLNVRSGPSTENHVIAQ